MLTPPRFREVCTALRRPETSPPLAKWHTILYQWKIHYIMAKLAPDAENPTTYSICDENLMNPQFWLMLLWIEPIPEQTLTDTQRRRAKNFV